MMAARRLDPEPQSFFHAPVMLNEVLAALAGTRGVLVDATAGGAGHSSALLRALPDVRLFAFDRDPRAVAASSERLAEFGERATVTHARPRSTRTPTSRPTSATPTRTATA